MALKIIDCLKRAKPLNAKLPGAVEKYILAETKRRMLTSSETDAAVSLGIVTELRDAVVKDRAAVLDALNNADSPAWKKAAPAKTETPKEKESAAAKPAPAATAKPSVPNSSPALSAGEQELAALLEGLDTSTVKSQDVAAAPSYTASIPPANLAAFISVAQKLIGEGIDTPQRLAESLSKINPAFRRFSTAIWGAFTMANPELPLAPDWHGIYSAMDKAAAPPGHLSDQVAAALATPEGLDRRGLAKLAEGSGLSAKEVDEAAELGIYKASRKIVTDLRASGAAEDLIFDRLVALYGRQPNLTSKTSASKVNQAYSTPVPLAFAIGSAIDLQGGELAYEPTAGNGLLTVAGNPANIIVNEMDSVRAENLRHIGFAVVTTMDAAAQSGPSTDRQIMNPPFGTLLEGGEKKEFVLYHTAEGNPVMSPNIDQAIVLKALEGLKKQGKAGIIIGGKKGTDAERAAGYRVFKTQLPFFNHLYQNYNVTDHFTVAGDLYEKQGAGWPVDVIIVDGLGKSSLPLPYTQAPPMLNTWEDVKARLITNDSNKQTQRTDSQTPVQPAGPGKGGPVTGVGGTRPGAEAGGENPAGSGNAGGGISGDQSKPGGGNASAPGVSGESGSGDQSLQPHAAGELTASDAEKPAGESARSEPRKPEIVDSENALQLEYLPRSKAPLLNAILVPRNLRDELREAFNDLEARRGDIDAFVLRELRWLNNDMGRLRAVLDGGQIDAVALAIDKIMLGTALITGDQTGMGKGRAAAAVMAWTQTQGHIPIFVTDGDALYLPMIQDFADIGAHHMVPYMTNSAITLKNDDGDVVARTAESAKQKAIARDVVASGKLPGNANVIFTTYHQIGKDRQTGFTEDAKSKSRRKKARVPVPDGDKVRMLRSLTGRAVFVMDEAHGAAGDSDVNYRMMQMLMGWNIANEIDKAPKPVGAYYSSATFAKRPDNMPIYSVTDLGKAVADPLKLPEIFAAGGVAMQQAASAMLARAGQYIRREMDYTGVTFRNEFIGDPATATNPAPEQYRQADAFTSPLRDIVDFSGEAQRLIAELNTLLMADGEMVDGVVYADQLQGTDFADLIHNMVNQYMLAVKAKSVGEQAVKLLAEGSKPLITVENTMEGPYEDTLAKGFQPNFQGLLHRYLVKALEVTRKKVDGRKVKESINLDELTAHPKAEVRTLALRLADQFDTIKSAIDDAKVSDLHISPLDTIIEQIEGAGYTVGEITGRQTGVKTNGKRFNRPGKDRKAAGKNRILSSFNNAGKDGERGFDALILNRSGSTGISAHAAPKFFDKRPRKMLIAQPNSDISVMMQMYGRIFRKGQISLPEYIHVLSQIAGERRIASVLARKMKGLKANTTSNTKGSEMTESADLFNDYGDIAAYETLERHPEIVEQLQNSLGGTLPPRFDSDGKDLIVSGGSFFKKVSGETNILPARWQDVFYRESEEEWHAIVAHETAMGTNLLSVEDLDFRAKATHTEELVAAVGPTEFEAAATLETLQTRSGRLPVPFAEVKQIMGGNRATVEASKSAWSSAFDKAAAERMAELKRVNGHRETWRTLEASSQARMARDKMVIEDAAATFGQTAIVDVDGSPARGVVTDFKFDESNPMLPSRQKAVIHINTSKRVISMPASRVRRNSVFAPLSNAEQYYDSSINTAAQRYVVTGNLIAGWEAIAKQGASGKIVTFTMDDGTVRSGMLLPMNYSPGDAMARVTTAQAMVEALSRGAVLRTPSALEIRLYGGDFDVRVPSARNRGGKYWRESAFTGLMDGGQMTARGNEMVGRVSSRNAASLFDFITKTADEKLTYTKPRGQVGTQRIGTQSPDSWARGNDEINAEMDGLVNALNRGELGPRGVPVGHPEYSGSMYGAQNRAADEVHNASMTPETVAAWDSDAAILREAYGDDAAKAMLMRKMQSGESLTPAEVRLALQFQFENEGNLKGARAVEDHRAFRMAWRLNGRTTAQALRARVDAHMTPAERMRVWLLDTVMQPAPEAAKAAQDKRDKAEKADNPDKKKRLLNEATQMEDDSSKLRLKQAEEALKRAGFTLDELINTEVHIQRKAPAFERMLRSMDEWKQRVIRKLQGGDVDYRSIARQVGRGEKEIRSVREEFEKNFTAWAMAQLKPGMTADDLVNLEQSPELVRSQPVAGMDDAAKQRIIAEAMMKMGLVPPDKQGRATIKRTRDGKRVPLDPDTVARMMLQRRQNKVGKTVSEVSKAVKEYAKSNDPTDDARDAFRDKLLGMGVARDTAVELAADVREEIMKSRVGMNTEKITYLDKNDPYQMAAWAATIASSRGDWLDMFREYSTAAALSGFPTFVSNASTVVSKAVTESIPLHRALEAGVNSLFTAVGLGDARSAQFGEIGHIYRHMAKGVSQGLILANMAVKTGVDFLEFSKLHEGTAPETAAEAKAYMEAMKKAGTEIPMRAIPGKLGHVVRAPLTGLLWTDVFGKTAMAHMHAAVMAYRLAKEGQRVDGKTLEGAPLTNAAAKTADIDARMETLLNTTNSPAWRYAIHEAKEDFFHEGLSEGKDDATNATDYLERRIAGVLGAINSALEHRSATKLGRVADLGLYLAKMAVFWFVRTPYNISRFMTRHTPLGLIPLTTRTLEGVGAHLLSVKSRHAETPTGRSFLEVYPKFMTHVANQIIAGLLYGLLRHWTTGDDDDDDKWFLITGGPLTGIGDNGENAANRMRHGGDYIIRIGPRDNPLFTFNYGRYEPLASVLGTTVDLVRSSKMDGGISAGRVMASIAGQIDQKTFMKGASDAIKLWQDVKNDRDSAVGSYLKRFSAVLVPNIIKAPIRAVDPVQRDTWNGEWWYDYLPLSSGAPARIDPATGREVMKSGNAVSRQFTLSGTDTSQPLPNYMQAITNYNATRGNKAFDAGGTYAPEAPESTLLGHPSLKRNEKIKLSPAVQTYFTQQTASLAALRLNGRVSAEKARHPDKATMDLIKDTFTEARKDVRDRLKRRSPSALGEVTAD